MNALEALLALLVEAAAEAEEEAEDLGMHHYAARRLLAK